MSGTLTMAEAVALGPTHLAEFVMPIPSETNWLQGGASVPYFLGTVKSSSGGTYFKVRFSGEMEDQGEGEQYIVDDPHPTRVVAEDVQSGEQILLIDFGLHGYDQMVVYGPAPDTKPLKGTYSWDGQTDFRVVVSATYNHNYDDPHEGFLEDVDAEGNLTLVTDTSISRTISFDDFRRDAFDWFQIEIVRADGERLEIVSAELA